MIARHFCMRKSSDNNVDRPTQVLRNTRGAPSSAQCSSRTALPGLKSIWPSRAPYKWR